MPTSAGQAGPSGGTRDDGYREHPLPAFGSSPDASDEQVEAVCTAWFMAELRFVAHMLRGFARGDPDRLEEAANLLALYYFKAVRNGKGVAGIVRAHLEGRDPIRHPKAVFITTIENHRQAVRRWYRTHGPDPTTASLSGDGPGEPSTMPRALIVDGDPVTQPESREPCLRIRGELVELSDRAVGAGRAGPDDGSDLPPDAKAQVDHRLDQLEALATEPLRRRDVFAAFTVRQRLVFLLRIDPLNVVESTALRFTQIVPLAGILGIVTTTDRLRQVLRTALLRLRSDHPDLKDELSYG